MGNRSAPIRRIAPAKINLFLQVTGKRADGYHDLFSLMCPIGIHDRIAVLPGTPRTTVRCRHPQVPEDGTNLAARAAEAFFTSLKRPERAAVVIEKRIPVGAGLGGGSSNAATVLKTLNDLYGRPFSTEKLSALGAAIGADVPFFIHGRTALVSGIGDVVEPFAGLPAYPLVVVFPGFPVSTESIYKNLNLALTKCSNQHNYRHLSKRAFRIERDLCNDLEACATARYPEILKVKQALLAHGARGALLSGSGSAVFGLFDDWTEAGKAAAALSGHVGWEVTRTRVGG